MKICIVGASGKLGQYMIEHALDRGCEVVCVCREKSVPKLDKYKGRIAIVPGNTDDRSVIERAVSACDGVLTVLVPWGVNRYATGTARAVLDFAKPDARLIFSCGWHVTRDGKDVYDWKLRWFVAFLGFVARLFRVVDLDDQLEATRAIFDSDRRWTVVRGSDLEEGPSQGLPVWSEHVGDPVLESNLTRRIDFALFMVEALTNDALIQKAPAIVGRQTASALAHADKASLAPTGRPGEAPMSAAGRLARLSGVLYLAIIVLGVWSDGVVRSTIVASGDAAKTSANILASTASFRLSLVADSLMILCDVALAITLYVLLRPASEVLAMMASAFRLVQSAVLGVNLLNQHVATLLLTDSGFSGAFDPTARDALVLMFAEAQGYGYDIGLLFFGVNCLLTGALIFRSGFLPRTLGILIGASGPVYLTGSYLSLLAPAGAEAFQVAYALPLVGELALCVWLLVKGVDVARWSTRTELRYGEDERAALTKK